MVIVRLKETKARVTMKFSEEHAFGMLIAKYGDEVTSRTPRDGEQYDNFKIGPIIFFLQARFFLKRYDTARSPDMAKEASNSLLRKKKKEEMPYVYFFFLILLTATTANNPASAIIPIGVSAGTRAAAGGGAVGVGSVLSTVIAPASAETVEVDS